MDFNVNQLEDWLSRLLSTSQKKLKLKRSGSTVNIASVPSLDQFYLYNQFLSWVNGIQQALRHKTEIELLNSLANNINILPLSCTVDDPEHQHRVVGIGLILSLELRPTIPNFMGVGGWLPSHHEPLGVLSTQGLVRDLAIREPINGINLREALTKFRLSYKAVLRLIIQLAGALFVGWSRLRLQFDNLDRDTIILRKIPDGSTSIRYGHHSIVVNYVLTLTDYKTASLSYQDVNYYKVGDKIELNQLLFDLASLTTGEVNQALQDVYEYTCQECVYHDKWWDNLIDYGLKNWQGMDEIVVSRSIAPSLIKQSVMTEGLTGVIDEPITIDYVKDIRRSILDNLEELMVVKNWESFQSRWYSIRKNIIQLLYLQEIEWADADYRSNLAEFNLKIGRAVGGDLRQLLHNYLIFKFSHPEKTPIYVAAIQARLAKLRAQKVM